MFGRDVVEAARCHARRDWPRESVGYVVAGRYVPKENIAANPLRDFRVPDEVLPDDVQAVIHSHPVMGAFPIDRDPRAPSKADMVGQLSAGIPFGILADNSRDATDILWWGDHVLDEPLLGRAFVPNVRDCYELVRAWVWQKRRIRLKSVPRDPYWPEQGGNVLEESFRSVGCRQIGVDEARAGDGLLIAVGSRCANHCAVLLENGLMIHHRFGKLSVKEPWSSAWRRLTKMAVRYER